MSPPPAFAEHTEVVDPSVKESEADDSVEISETPILDEEMNRKLLHSWERNRRLGQTGEFNTPPIATEASILMCP